MTCGVSHERLWAYAHGEDDDDASRDEITAHLPACAPCRQSVSEMRALLGDLEELGAAPPPPSFRGATVGGYRILSKLGEGGMGVVYEAEQDQPRRRIALKVIRGHAADEHQVRQFQREAQTLARLNHPGIAAIYQAGREESGQHFFAMELVHGVPLTRYCLERGASQRERLELFCRVCDAVQHAHQKGVIHRDLKPANILVVEPGDEPSSFVVDSSVSSLSFRRPPPGPQPKVLDFGLARLTESETGGQTIAAESGRVLGTLHYMAPEQAQGRADQIDTRTDVYALGVILYELLTDTLPYDLDGALLKAIRTICEREPIPPTQRAPGVPGELSAITLKALEKNPERRYGGVGELADDVRRYLAGHPVLARPASGLYRLRKLVARNRVVSALSGLVLLSLMAATVVSAWQERRTRRERDRAEAQVRMYESVWDAFERVAESPDPWQRQRSGVVDVTVREALDAVARRVEQQLATEPLTAAKMLAKLAWTYRNLGEYAAAERQTRAALAAYRAAQAENPRAAAAAGVTDAEVADALLLLGESLVLLERHEQAHAALQEALEILRAQYPDETVQIAKALNNLGAVARRLGKLAEAEALLRSALRLRQQLAQQVEPEASDAAARITARTDVAQAQNNLAGLLTALAETGERDARLAEAERLYRESLRARTECLGPEHPDVAKTLNNLGKLLQTRGAHDEAERLLREALRILRQELVEAHPYIALALYNLAALRLEMGGAENLAAAERYCVEALAVWRSLAQAESGPLARAEALLEDIRAARLAAGSSEP